MGEHPWIQLILALITSSLTAVGGALADRGESGGKLETSSEQSHCQGDPALAR